VRNKTPLRVSPTDVLYVTVTKHRVPNRPVVQHGPSPENRLRTATRLEVRIVRPPSPLVMGDPRFQAVVPEAPNVAPERRLRPCAVPALWGARSVPDVSRVTAFGTVDMGPFFPVVVPQLATSRTGRTCFNYREPFGHLHRRTRREGQRCGRGFGVGGNGLHRGAPRSGFREARPPGGGPRAAEIPGRGRPRAA
jgi:hypothetical protein